MKKVMILAAVCVYGTMPAMHTKSSRIFDEIKTEKVAKRREGVVVAFKTSQPADNYYQIRSNPQVFYGYIFYGFGSHSRYSLLVAVPKNETNDSRFELTDAELQKRAIYWRPVINQEKNALFHALTAGNIVFHGSESYELLKKALR